MCRVRCVGVSGVVTCVAESLDLVLLGLILTSNELSWVWQLCVWWYAHFVCCLIVLVIANERIAVFHTERGWGGSHCVAKAGRREV